MVAKGTILSNRYLLQDDLGAGGMSTVYAAVDLRTGATVAVKIPHAFLLSDPQNIERLKREAQIAATIQSTRVARVTDVADHEGIPYFVMEYVPGETLADLIARQGALPGAEVVRIGIEVARALEAAHARGVVHRDLKPHNIRLTPEGDVKVVDFGIARVQGMPGITSASLFVGTPDYASPERAEGEGDIRADVYSVGVVLYEMLTGALPFKGGTPWTVLKLHATEPPPPLPPDAPAELRTVVERCLLKAPEERYQTPRELVEALQSAARALSLPFGARAVDSLPATRMMEAPARNTVEGVQPEMAAAAPRGTLPPTAAPATATVVTPRESAPPPPRQESPKKKRSPLPLLAGALVLLLVVAGGAFFLLNRDDSDAGEDSDGPTPTEIAGTAVVPPVNTGGMSIVQPREGTTVSGPVLVQIDPTGFNLKSPAEEDPRGRHIHYFLDVDPATVVAPGAPVPTGRSNVVHTASAQHTFQDVPPGQHTVWVVMTGNDHVPLSPTVQGKVTFNVVADPLANARTGEESLVLYQGFVDQKWRIFVMDGKGENARRLTSGNANDYNPSWSPDGSRIAFESDREGTRHIYTMNPDGSDLKRITEPTTQPNRENRNVAWSPDGNELVFVSNRDGQPHIWAMPSAGGQARQLTRGTTTDGAPHWSPDGSRIAYASDTGTGVTHIFTVDVRGGSPSQLTDGAQRDNYPVWSPDGKKIAFASFRNNAWNIYVMNADGSDVKKVSDGTFDIEPSWSPDGKQILFQSEREGEQQIMVVSAEGGEARRLSQKGLTTGSPSWPLR